MERRERDESMYRGGSRCRWIWILPLLTLVVLWGAPFAPAVAQTEPEEVEASADAASVAEDVAAGELAEVEELVEAEVEEWEADVDVPPPPPRHPERPERAPRHRVRKDTQVVFGSTVRVEEHEVARDVVAIGGSVYIDGEVRGDAVSVGGSAWVDAEVSGDVVAVGGTIELGPEAVVRGDVVSVGGTVEMDPEAIVHGQVSEVAVGQGLNFGFPGMFIDWEGHRPFFEVFGLIWTLICLAVLFLLACLAMLLFRRPLERIGEQAMEEPWKSGLVGLLAQVLFFPLLIVAVIVLVISIIGIPLLLLLPFALLAMALVALLGYAAIAHRIGLWAERRFGWKVDSPYVSLLIGVLIVEMWGVFGELLDMGGGFLWFFALMFGLVGFLIEYVTWTMGFGAALLTRFGTLDAQPSGAEAGAGLAPPTDEAVRYAESAVGAPVADSDPAAAPPAAAAEAAASAPAEPAWEPEAEVETGPEDESSPSTDGEEKPDRNG